MEKNRRLLAIVMAALMIFTLIPSMVFAAPSGEMGGKLKVEGYPYVGSTLKADFVKAAPEGITNDDVSFTWSRKISEEELKEVGTEKKYKVTEEDLGYKLVLEVTGKGDLTGSLEVTTPEVTSTKEEAIALVEAEIAEKGESVITVYAEEAFEEETPVENVQVEEVQEDEGEWAEVTEEEIPVEEVPQDDTQASSEGELEEEFWEENEDETVDGAELDVSVSEELNTEDVGEAVPDVIEYGAEAVTEDGTGLVDLGTVEIGKESDAAAYVTIHNTGNGTLNFDGLSPQNFMVADITEPLGAGEKTDVWVQPREGLEPGDYLDTITYTTEEGAEAFYQVQMTLTEPQEESTDTPTEEPTEAAPVYGISSDMDALIFDNLTEGYTEVVSSWTVTFTNSGEDTVTMKVPQSEFFDITQVVPEGTEGSLVLEKGGQASFNIQPKLNLAAGTYSEELVFGIEESADITKTVKADFVVDAAKEQISISVNPESVKYSAEAYEAGEPTEVLITNTGNTTVVLAQPVAEFFDILPMEVKELAPGEAVTLGLQPRADLEMGNFEEMIQIFQEGNTENPLAELPAVIEVKEEAEYKLTVTPDVLDFGSAYEGYESPDAQKVTVFNEGNTAVEIEKPYDSDYFKIGDLSKTVLEPGEKASFNVRPLEGLEEGSYSEYLIISNNAGLETVVEAMFTVEEKSIELLEIQKPSAITGVKNGAKKSAEGLGLPSTVTIKTSEGKKKAKVKWNVEDCSYEKGNKEAQTFTVKGKVSLPEGVENPGEVSLSTSVKVSVKAAYVPKIADPANNKIRGISSDGYTTQSKISFEAVGAGMDNTSPRKGDVRYEPVKWKVINTNSWQGAPYSATFGITKAGNYTLKVLFERQEFDGEAWDPVGDNSTKSVNFSIAQGQVVTPTPNAQTREAEKRNAVATGDTTAILPFVIILIVAVICIAGIVVYRKKKK